MEFLKSWFDLLREVRSGQFWWSLALLACFADWYLLVRFDTGLIGWIHSLPAFAEMSFRGYSVSEGLHFAGAVALTWFYLLPLVVVPLWKRAMFELNWFLFDDYRNSPKRKGGWRLLSTIQATAALSANSVLYDHCLNRAQEIAERRHQLTCLLGIALFCALAMFADVSGESSLAGGAISSWMALPTGMQLVVFLISMPAIAVLVIIANDQNARFDHYIRLPEQGTGE